MTLLATALIKVLILTGETDLPYHHWDQSTPFLRDLLQRTGRFEVKVTEEPRGLTPEALSRYDVLVLNYNGPRWGPTAERAVENFLRSGKGMLAFHGVSYGPFYGQDLKTRKMAGEPWPAYADMMDMTWKIENVGHSARHVFPVKWKDPSHPMAKGLPPTFLANDELYHKMDFKPGIQVIASAFSDPKVGGTGREEPIIWSVPFGEGRVVHTSLGHDLSAMSQPGFLNAFARGIEWAATRKCHHPPDRIRAPGAAQRRCARSGGHRRAQLPCGLLLAIRRLRRYHLVACDVAGAGVSRRHEGPL